MRASTIKGVCTSCYAGTTRNAVIIRASPLHELQAILERLPLSAVLAQASKTGEPARQGRVPAGSHAADLSTFYSPVYTAIVHSPLDPKPEESKALPFIHGELQSQEHNLHTRRMAVGSECSSAAQTN